MLIWTLFYLVSCVHYINGFFDRQKLSIYLMRAAGQIDPTEDLGGVTLIGHRIP